jgi:ATP-binding cassette subfamily F protein 3
VYALEKQLEHISEMMSKTDPHSTRYRELEEKHQLAEDAFRSLDGYQAQVKIDKVLTGLGFGSFDRKTPVRTLSGGEYTRLMLCRLLVESPDLLILDEATNHLDFSMLSWLEAYLSDYRGAILAVSHDRYFLDRVTSTTWELEQGTVVRYPAPYGRYLALREQRLERLEKEYEAHQREVARLSDYVARNMARASTAASAKSRLRMIEHLGEAKRPAMPERPPRIVFESGPRPVQTVLQTQGLILSVKNNTNRRILVDNLSLTVLRGERLAIVGPNGAGKTTLLKALTGSFPLDFGSINWGRNVHTALYAQDAGDIAPDKRVIDTLWDAFPKSSELKLRSTLAGFGLTGDDVFKNVGMLSGGERARLKLAHLSMENANVLLLDEPTNHLDVNAREALENALRAYEGTLLVFHTTVGCCLVLRGASSGSEETVHIGSLKTGSTPCSRNYFKKQHPSPQTQKKPAQDKINRRSRAGRALSVENNRTIALIEEEIAKAEDQLLQIHRDLSSPDIISDHIRLTDLTQQLYDLQNHLENLYQNWHDAVDNSNDGGNILARACVWCIIGVNET